EKYGAAGRLNRPAVCSCIVRRQLVLPLPTAAKTCLATLLPISYYKTIYIIFPYPTPKFAFS
ncbi:MAG: hypothetical protein IKD10_02650, partial [Lentisphaeria bacterium]|nr:hypothetical protein [Lentisphaeria bacterium]